MAKVDIKMPDDFLEKLSRLGSRTDVIAETVLRFPITHITFFFYYLQEKRLPWIGSRFSGEIIILSCL